MNKKAIFSLIETGFVLFILSGVSIYMFFELNDLDEYSSYDLNSKSFIHNFEFDQNQKNIIVNEDLSQLAVTNDWSNVTQDFSHIFNNYGLYVGNLTHQKKIRECNNTLKNRQSYYRLILTNNSVHTSRTLRFEVCY